MHKIIWIAKRFLSDLIKNRKFFLILLKSINLLLMLSIQKFKIVILAIFIGNV